MHIGTQSVDAARVGTARVVIGRAPHRKSRRVSCDVNRSNAELPMNCLSRRIRPGELGRGFGEAVDERQMANLTRVALELPVTNMAQALQHYDTQLGFDVVMTMPTGDYAIVERDGRGTTPVRRCLRCRHAEIDSHLRRWLGDLEAELQNRGAQFTQTIVRQPSTMGQP
jgi:hypothetical protein